MKEYMKRAELTDLDTAYGGTGDLNTLGKLRKYLQVHTAKEVLGRDGVRISTHSFLDLADSIRDHGVPMDASFGEAGHQRHKRANKSGSGRDPAAHHIRRVNTGLSLERMKRYEPWISRGFDRVTRKHVDRPVVAGAGATRVLTALANSLPGGLDGPENPDEPTVPIQGAQAGRYPGAAIWDAKIVRIGECLQRPVTTYGGHGWEANIAQSGLVPREKASLDAAHDWYSCNGSPGAAACENDMRPSCWQGPGRLVNNTVHCSRFKHGAPLRASNGLGRWKGGDVRSSTPSSGATPREWVFGDGSGEDVEIFVHREARDECLTGDCNVTLGRILYFFQHEGNMRDLVLPQAL